MSFPRSAPAPRHDGKPAWYGVKSDGKKVVNGSGLPIIYTTPEAAVAAASL